MVTRKKPTEPQLARALKEVRCLRTDEPGVCALEFIDSSDCSFCAVVNSDGISSVIGRLLDQACNPEFHAAALAASPELAECRVSGSGMALLRGRSPTEIAVTLPMGCVNLVVYVPLAQLLMAFAGLAGELDNDSPK